jgi:poly(3-hydroxybutyrate) depolymerase
MRPCGLLFLGALTLACGGVTRGPPSSMNTSGGNSTNDSDHVGGRAGSDDAGGTSGGSAGQYMGCQPNCHPQDGLGFAGASVSMGGSSTQVGPPVDLPWPSSGCGLPLPAEQVPTSPGSRSYTEYHVTQTGATLGADDPTNGGERQLFVRVPNDYEPNRPYRVVYVLQGCGATRAADRNTYPLFDERLGGVEHAVYVAVSVPDNQKNPGCYDNNSGELSQEWEAFDLIHSFVESRFCVDNNRIFTTGYSTGGYVSNMWGCYFGGTPSPPLDAPDVAAGRAQRKFSPRWAVRGRALVTGGLPPNQPTPCNGPGAGLWFSDPADQASPIRNNIAALNLALQTNGCAGNYEDGPKEPWAPAEKIRGLQGGVCQHYTGCSAEMDRRYPLVFCTTQGFGHGDSSGPFIPTFSAFASLIDPKP